jgi:amidase
MIINDTVAAFVDHGRVVRQDRRDGPLAGRTFGLKDFFDIAGVPTGGGSPEWLATHKPPEKTAPAVQQLFDAGAKLVGKTHTDELGWSLNGQNAHYGTPINVAAPGRIPGGSSSGSAAATAAGLVDFAIGSDTGGSVRLPASYCGIYGIRTSHGLIPLEGSLSLAPSYDTFGWFARNPTLLAEIGRVLIEEPDEKPFRRLLIAKDLFDHAGPVVKDALHLVLTTIQSHFPESKPIVVAADAISDWRKAFQLIQSWEAWTCYGKWIEREKPKFGPGIRERFAAAASVNPADVKKARRLRDGIRKRMCDLIRDDDVLVLPSAPGIAPLLGTPPRDLDTFRGKALDLLCPAGHAGLPQVSIPGALHQGCPIGISIMGSPHSDLRLLHAVEKIG